MTTVRRGIPALFLGALLCLLLLLCLTPSAWADGSTVADLQTAINSGDASFTLTDDMTISDGFFDGRYGLTLIVPTDKTLTVTGGTVELSGLTLDGGTVELSGKCTFRVNDKLTYNSGTVNVLGECYNLFPAADVQALTDFSQVFFYASDDLVTSLLYAPTTDAEASAAINSINDLNERFFADLVIKFPWTVTGDEAITHKTQLRINCGAGGSLTVAKDASFSHMSRGNVFINNGGVTENLPVCKNLGFMNIGSFHIESGCTFSSSGIAEIQSLDLGGSVVLDGGTFRVNNKLNTNGGKVKALDECFNLFPAEDVLALTDFSSVFSYASEDLKTNLLFKANNASEFAAALSTINDLTDRFIADLQINGRCDLEGENIFNHKTEIRVNADRGGSLSLARDALLANNGNGGNVFFDNNSRAASPAVSEICGELNTNGLSLAPGCELTVDEGGWVKTHDRLNIPESAKLTLTKGQLQLMDNSVAEVGGTLENNGYMSLRNRIGSNPRLVIDGGTYSGDGRIDVEDTVDPDSYFSGLNLDLFTEVPGNNATIYLPIKIDLVLPTGLTEIGAQAFANDTFASIFIPPTVTAIADDAFAGMSGLTIFGFPGTAAQNVIGDSFTFISVG